MKCGKSIFNLENSGIIDYSWFRDSSKLFPTTTAELAANIKFSLDNQNDFVTSVNQTENQEEKDAYLNSVTDFINAIISKTNKFLKNPKFKKDLKDFIFDESLLKSELENYFSEDRDCLSEEKTLVDLEITDEDRQEQQSQTLKADEHFIFGTNVAAKLFRDRAFKSDISIRTIVDVENGILVDNDVTLNQEIQNYKATQYRNLYNFLRSLGLSKGLPNSLYRTNADGSINVMSMQPALEVFYSYLKKCFDAESLEMQVDSAWQSRLFNKNDSGSSFMDAISAYINLSYFDELAKQALGEVLTIREDLEEPISTRYDDDTNDLIIEYKYSYGKSTENKVKSWNTNEIRNAINETGKFTRCVIESIPMLDYQANAKMNRNVSLVHFATAFVNLFDAIHNLSITPGISEGHLIILKDAANSFHADGLNQIQIILETLFMRDNKTVLNSLKQTGRLNDFDLNILKSVYEYVYKAKGKSIKTIEQTYFKNNGKFANYPITYAITATIDRTMSMNYLETVWDEKGDRSRMSSRIKRKYTNMRTVFDTVDAVNTYNIDRADKGQLVNSYKLEKSKDADGYWNLTIGNNIYSIDTTKTTLGGILDKSPVSKIQIVGLSNLENIDITNPTIRKKLLDEVSLSNQEQKFIQLIRFIDSILLTNFAADTHGMQRLSVYKQLAGQNWLKELTVSAVQGLQIIKLYNEFESKVDATGKPMPITKFKENLVDFDNRLANLKDGRKSRYKAIFSDTYTGAQLNTLYTGLNWLEKLSDADAIISGETSKAVTKNLSGDSIANYSPAFLGAQIHYNLKKSSAETSAASSKLLFVNNQNSIVDIVEDTDIKFADGKTKAIKELSQGELLTHSILHKFIGSQFTKDGVLEDAINRKIVIQPTTYSDKTKFVNYIVNATVKSPDKGLSFNLLTCSESEIENLYLSSIGEAYKTAYNSVLNDYSQIYGNQVKDENGKVNLFKIQNLLKTKTEKQLIKDAQAAGVELSLDTHYRKLGKSENSPLALNELLIEYNFNVYNSKENLHNRLALEKLNFLKALVKNRVSFKTNINAGSGLNDITTVLVSELGNSKINAKEWISGETLILGKIRKLDGTISNIIYGADITLQEGETLELNPVLNRYFMVSNLVNNNMRFSLTGNETNHAVKSLPKFQTKAINALIDNNIYNIIADTINFDKTKLKLIDMNIGKFESRINQIEQAIVAEPNTRIKYAKELKQLESDLKSAKENLVSELSKNISLTDLQLSQQILASDPSTLNIATQLSNILKSILYTVESAAQMAQLKRNVIIPATMQYYMQGCIDGIASTMNVAVVRDIRAKIFNFSGDEASEDAHDGSAFICPFTSILENNSLQDQSVGTIKKPIWHDFNQNTFTATLVKFAADTITNAWMRQSLLSDASLYELHKKMTNVRWSKKNVVIDLINGKGHGVAGDPEINFQSDILAGNRLFYEDVTTGIHHEIVDFGVENGIYYTKEVEVGINGESVGIGKASKVYHIFDSKSNHSAVRVDENEIYTLPEELINQGYHTIDSLFELQESLGGIFSESTMEDANGRTKLVPSESSVYAVVNFMNSVSTLKTNGRRDDFTQASYDQPLKKLLIDYVANNSAVKNGAANINDSSVFNSDNDEELSYMTLNTDGYGIQMDADHEANEAVMTEFSQVISSLDAGGRIHEYVSPIYEVLGQIALEECEIELSDVETLINTDDASDLYDTVGRVIIQNVGGNQSGLSDKIISELAKTFNLNTNHLDDVFKIPFSDPNVYSQILSSFVSRINGKAIKKKYPGAGTVMAPGFNISQIFKLGGEPYMIEDIIKKAISEKDTKPIPEKLANESLANYRKRIAQNYLEHYYDGTDYSGDKDPNNKWSKNKDIFSPTDIVDVGYVDPITQQFVTLAIFNLDQMTDSNGKPGYYSFKSGNYELSYPNGVELIYRQNVTKPRNLAPVRLRFEYTDANTGETKQMNIFDHYAIRDAFLHDSVNPLSKETRQRVFDQLDKGIYEDEFGIQHKAKIIENADAELIVSNMFLSKFGVETTDSLVDIRAGHFNKISTKVVPSNKYNMLFIKNDRRHTYVTFEKGDGRLIPWGNNIKRRKFDGESDSIVNSVYAIDEDGIVLYEIGRDIINDNVKWDNSINKFVDINGVILANQKNYIKDGNRVLETVYFVNKYKVTEQSKNGKIYKFDLISIDKDALYKCFESNPSQLELENFKVADGTSEEVKKILYKTNEVNRFIGRSILGKLYNSDKYCGIQLNEKLDENIAKQIPAMFSELKKSVNYDQGLVNLIDKSILFSKTKPINGIVSINKSNLQNALRVYNTSRMEAKKVSFEKSLEFIASRIPAQTHQSFMKMKAVGFTGSDKNVCYVSHWQTWLQGSDYDIDKAYIMGHNFDNNGQYIGWSNLFSYSSFNALRASEALPMPKKLTYTLNEVSKENTVSSELEISGNLAQEFQTVLDIEQQIKNKKQEHKDATESTVKALISNEIKNLDVLRINAYAKLLTDIYTSKESVKKLRNQTEFIKLVFNGVDTNHEMFETVLTALNNHEHTNIPRHLKQGALRNFISSHIEGTISNVRNLIGAYSPIDMGIIGDAAKQSPKNNESASMTLMDPSVIYRMQYQNMTGKNVIGIAATGEKASFMLHFYYNDIIRRKKPVLKNLESAEEYKNRLQEWRNHLTRAALSLETTRIRGRAKAPQRKYFTSDEEYQVALTKYGESVMRDEIKRLPDINPPKEWEDLDIEILNAIPKECIPGNITVDLMISQILSAATDNAKELILAKINAGSKLAKMYLYLVTMGFDIYDIVSFMTSPTATFIDTISEENAFGDFNISIQDAINILLGNNTYSLATRIFNNLSYYTDRGEKITASNCFKEDNSLSIDNIKDILEGRKTFSELKQPTELKERILFDMAYNIINSILVHMPTRTSEVLADAAEFKKILANANEFSAFGQLLGINQGIPTSKADLNKYVGNIERIVNDRLKESGFDENKFKEIFGKDYERFEQSGIITKFDGKRWLRDAEYREVAKDFYNAIKGTFNVFEIVDELPHFKAMFEILNTVVITDSTMAVKSNLYNSIAEDCIAKGINPNSTKYSNLSGKILNFVDTMIVTSFFKSRPDLKIPIKKGWKYLDKYARTVVATADMELEMSTIEGLASFKYVMEQYIIPQLISGNILVTENGQHSFRYDDKLRGNKFLLGLIPDSNQGVSMYKLNIEMNNFDKSDANIVKYQNYLSGLQNLAQFNFGGRSVSDWFMLYNLYVNKNSYGNDRMTKLFEQFINTSGYRNSILNDYLQFEGNIDYARRTDLFNYSIQDFFISIAPIISEGGKTDYPIYRKVDTSGEIKYYSSKTADTINVLPSLYTEVAQNVERMNNYNRYFLSGMNVFNQIEEVDRILTDLPDTENSDSAELVEQILQIFRDKTKEGILTLSKYCD